MSQWLVGWFASLGSIKMVKNCIGRMPKYGRPTRWRISRGYLKFMWATERFCASSSEHRTPSGSQLTADKKEQPFRGTRSLRLVDLAKTVGRVPAESSTGNTCSARASSSLGPACVYHAPVNMMMTAADDYGFYAVPKNLGRPRILKPYYVSIFKRFTASKISFWGRYARLIWCEEFCNTATTASSSDYSPYQRIQAFSIYTYVKMSSSSPAELKIFTQIPICAYLRKAWIKNDRKHLNVDRLGMSLRNYRSLRKTTFLKSKIFWIFFVVP